MRKHSRKGNGTKAEDICFRSPLPSAGTLPLRLLHTSSPHGRGICFDILVLPGDSRTGTDGRCTPAPQREEQRSLCKGPQALLGLQGCGAIPDVRQKPVGNKTTGAEASPTSCEACACSSGWGKAWAQLTLFQMSLPSWYQPPRPLTRPGPQAVPGRARRG